MAGPAPGTIMAEDYFGSAPEWGEEADGGQVRGQAASRPEAASLPRPRGVRAGQAPGAGGVDVGVTAGLLTLDSLTSDPGPQASGRSRPFGGLSFPVRADSQ